MTASMRSRVVAVLPSFAGGGAERVTITLLRGLDRSQFDVTLVVLDDTGPLKSLLPRDTPLVALQKPRLRYALPALLAALRRLKPDILFSSLGYVNLALAASRAVLPGKLILREANLPSLALPRAPQPTLTRMGYRLLYRRADAILATSQRMVAELQALGAPESRLSVLRNPVDLASLRKAAGTPRRAPGSGLRIVAAGRLVAQKGFDRLVPLLQGVPELHLTILGDGPMHRSLEALGRQHGVSMSLPGFVTDGPAWFAGADLVVLPSRWEGMPNVALEALAAGTPVVATPESGGIAEVAAAAAPGAVTVAPFGPEFRNAIAGIAPRVSASVCRASLLPEEYTLDLVNQRFSALLHRVESGR